MKLHDTFAQIYKLNRWKMEKLIKFVRFVRRESIKENIRTTKTRIKKL